MLHAGHPNPSHSMLLITRSSRSFAVRAHPPFFILTLCLCACAVVFSGCVERVDAPLPVNRDLAAQAGQWQDAGSFGGHAELEIDSADPWERRFDSGTFETIAGVEATQAEVWVCDIGISRLQVFDFEGRLLRTLGSGVPIKGTAPDDRELFRFMEEVGQTENPFERTAEGLRWVGAEREHFIAADVYVQDTGYVIADQARTGIESHARRQPGIVSIPFDPTQPVIRLPGVEPGWWSYVDGAGSYFTASDPLRNIVMLFAPARPEGNPSKTLGGNPTMSNVMSALFAPADYPIPYPQLLLSAGQASGTPGKFNDAGGVAIAFDKTMACDSGNRRIQVFEARADEEYFWGKLLRVIDARDEQGRQRFVVPRDIEIASDGRVYVLDTARQEVVELSPRFERLGVVAKGFGDAYALDLSPDGRHLFVTDRGSDTVHHYARVD